MSWTQLASKPSVSRVRYSCVEYTCVRVEDHVDLVTAPWSRGSTISRYWVRSTVASDCEASLGLSPVGCVDSRLGARAPLPTALDLAIEVLEFLAVNGCEP